MEFENSIRMGGGCESERGGIWMVRARGGGRVEGRACVEKVGGEGEMNHMYMSVCFWDGSAF